MSKTTTLRGGLGDTAAPLTIPVTPKRRGRNVTPSDPVSISKAHDLLASLVPWLRSQAGYYCRWFPWHLYGRDDLFQEFCCDVLQKAHGFDPARGSAAAWACGRHSCERDCMMGFHITEAEYADWQRKGLVPDAPPSTTTAVAVMAPSRVASNRKRIPVKTIPVTYLARIRLTIELPGVQVKSEANIGGGLSAKIARKSALKDAVRESLPSVMLPFAKPILVTFTRIGSKKLDDDNLEHAFKSPRDVVAEWLGMDDGDTDAVRFKYRQRPGYRAGIEIVIG